MKDRRKLPSLGTLFLLAVIAWVVLSDGSDGDRTTPTVVYAIVGAFGVAFVLMWLGLGWMAWRHRRQRSNVAATST